MTEKNANNEPTPTEDLDDADLEEVAGGSSYWGHDGQIQTCIG